MDNVTRVSAGLALGAPRSQDSPEKVLDAARQFEALLTEQLLRNMRESAQSGWMESQGDKSSESLMEFAEQEFAKVIAAGGGFGLARMIAQNLQSPPR